MNQKPLPGASDALTMGILSIALTLFCCGPFGAIFSVLGLNNYKKAARAYEAHPGEYSGYETAKTGKVLSYVGLALAGLMLLFLILYIGVILFLVASGEMDGDWH